MWYYLKTRSLWFFTASNPTMEFGGFEGEAKSNIYKQIPSGFCADTIIIDPTIPFSEVEQKLKGSSIEFPFIVKPDVGKKGILCRKIEHLSQLEQYHNNLPVNYLIQKFIDLPLEVSVFYYRMPNEAKGHVTAVIQKDLPEVIGDGESTISELIFDKYETAKWLQAIEVQLGAEMNRVLNKDEAFCLSPIANVYNGAQFVNLPHLIDEKLLDIFDRISYKTRFYYGRYDIKCASLEHLRKGEFIILEFNGAGSVPNHISTASYTSLLSAYKELLMHWKVMYEISVYNNKHGYPYWNFIKGRNFLRNSKKHFDVLKKLNKTLSLKANMEETKSDLQKTA